MAYSPLSTFTQIAEGKCTDAKPSDTPRIRKIDADPDHVIIYTTAVAQNNSYYFIAYGLQPGDERYGVQFNHGPSSGHWVSYKINNLTPKTTYYFKVRGGNGCKPGNWSTWVKVKTPAFENQLYYF